MPLPRVCSEDEVLAQGFAFKASWWSRYVEPPWWPDGIDELPDDPARPYHQRIARQDVFNMAADRSPEGRFGLLLAAYIWGTGTSAFNVGRRVRGLTRTQPGEVGDRLVAAADLLEAEGPVAAYASLQAGSSNHIKFLGPAFFTKYLYFAAGHPTTVKPQPLILDKFVARSVNAVFDGWTLRDHGWSARTYGQYLTLAAEQTRKAGPPATPAGVEMALFQAHTQRG